MINQQTYPQSLNNPLAVQIHPSMRWYSFRELPKAMQEKLLSLQRNSGDALKIGTSNLGLKIFFLTATLCILFFYIFVAASAGMIMSTVFLAGGSILFMWLAFFAWKLYQTARLPVENNIYLTPTQLIEVEKGLVRYRELLDVSIVELHTIRGRSGSNNYLNLKFKDGDRYQYPFPIGWFSSSYTEAEKWQGKASMWQNYALGALQRRDAAYFNSWNVFPGLEKMNLSIRKKSSNFLPVSILLLITFALPVLALAGLQFTANRRYDQEKWNAAVTKNTAASYQGYLKYNDRGSHLDEAAQKINTFYDDDIKKFREIQSSAFDRNGVDAVLNLLDNARSRKSSELKMEINDNSMELVTADLQKNIAAQLNRMFPSETLLAGEKISYAPVLQTEPSIKIEVNKQPEQIKPANKSVNKNSGDLKTAKKYDFKCTIKVPGKTDYSFDLKSAGADEFNSEFAKRLGFSS